MSHREQIEALVGELDNVINRFREEFDLPVASVLGCIDIIKASIIRNAMEGAEDDDEP